MNTLDKIKALKSARIQNEQAATAILTQGYSVDLAPIWEQLDELAHTSKAIWDKTHAGKKQVRNSYNANFTGHASEMTALCYYQQCYQNVEAPDITAYLQNQEETSKFDILADDVKIQVKGISQLLSSKYQVTPYNTNKYNEEGTDEICFVYIDKEAKRGYVYGRSTPAAMLADNTQEPNDQGKQCFTAKNVLLK
ncbi:hypothetical protein [Vibrio fortis]|uniref:hypothetical protein n=1 Tax=Vibrio fortis TaxID=212667 RepID=UPI0038CD4A19